MDALIGTCAVDLLCAQTLPTIRAKARKRRWFFITPNGNQFAKNNLAADFLNFGGGESVEDLGLEFFDSKKR